MSPGTEYRQLDEPQIAATLTRLRDRIAERFPGSGLSRVAEELLSLSNETAAFVTWVRRPHWPIRAGAGIAIAAMLAVLVVVASSLPLSAGVSGYADFVQAMDAAISDATSTIAASCSPSSANSPRCTCSISTIPLRSPRSTRSRPSPPFSPARSGRRLPCWTGAPRQGRRFPRCDSRYRPQPPEPR